MNDVTMLRDLIIQAQKIVFFGGAGVSTNSGIPDFRSARGLFVEEPSDGFSPEQMVSSTCFHLYPKRFFQFYFDKLVYPNAQPSVAHHFAVWLEKTMKKEVTIVTQNIDGLHQKAGSSKVLELHGSVLRNYCISCGHFYHLDQLVRDEEGIPRCTQDGGMIKPDVVLYEEALNQKVFNASIEAISKADLLLVVGTSLMVYPAAGLIDYFQGKKIILINREPLAYSGSNVYAIQREMGSFFREIIQSVQG